MKSQQKLKIAIIEDEQSERENIRAIIETVYDDIEVIGEAPSIAKGLQLLTNNEPDIVLFDIDLEDGTSFDLIQKLGNINFKAIFLTAFENYAVKAFKISAIDYILKPYKSSELVNAINKAKQEIEEQINYKRLEVLFYNKGENKDKQIVLHTFDSIHVVKLSEIIRCQSDNNYTHFYLQNGKEIIVSKSLKEYEEMISEYKFCRVHQSHLVNLSKIERFDKKDGGTLVMSNGNHVPVSQSKKSVLLDYLSSL